MKNNKLLGIILWFIGLAVECILLFCFAREYSAAVWVTFGFTLFAYFSQLALWLYVWRDPLTADENFLHMPLFMLSVVYLLMQAVPCLVFAIWQGSIKITVLVNAALAIIMWVLLVLSMIAKNHIKQTGSRQKDHHKEL